MLTRRSSWIAATTCPSLTNAAPAVWPSLIPRVTIEVKSEITSHLEMRRRIGLLPPLREHDGGRYDPSRFFLGLFARVLLQSLCRQVAAGRLLPLLPRSARRASPALC